MRLSPLRYNGWKCVSLFAPLVLGFMGLLGCKATPHRADLEALHLVLKGKATPKQRILLFERTTYEVLLERSAYFVKSYPGDFAGVRPLGQKQCVQDVIEEVDGAESEKPRFYFLLRGIGEEETIFRGHAGELQAVSLALIPGDLLIVAPPATHFLFKSRRKPAEGAGKSG